MRILKRTKTEFVLGWEGSKISGVRPHPIVSLGIVKNPIDGRSVNISGRQMWPETITLRHMDALCAWWQALRARETKEVADEAK